MENKLESLQSQSSSCNTNEKQNLSISAYTLSDLNCLVEKLPKVSQYEAELDGLYLLKKAVNFFLVLKNDIVGKS